MRAAWILAALALAMSSAAYAQSYQYVAQTSAPAARTGAVTAGTLIWQCSGSQCTINGPWPAPGVAACVALAQQVGRIASYGRSGAMLSAAQLTQCNAGLPAATLQIDPRVAAQIRPQGQQPVPQLQRAPPVMAPAPTATVTMPTQVAVEPGLRPEDIRVFALSGSGISFHGTTGALPAPALPAPQQRIVDGRLTVPAITLQASSPGATPTARSTTIRPPFFRGGSSGDVFLRVSISMRDMPSDALGVGLECHLSRGRYVPSPVHTSPYVDLWSDGSGAEEAVIADGDVELQMTNINRWETTIDVPLRLRPFQRLQDARSYGCAVRMFVDRVSPPGREQLMIESLVNPSSSTSRAPYHPAAGTTPQLSVRGNIQ